MPDESPPPKPDTPPVKHCPWCAYTADVLKKVLHHMGSAHHQRWCDRALYPPIAGTVAMECFERVDSREHHRPQTCDVTPKRDDWRA